MADFYTHMDADERLTKERREYCIANDSDIEYWQWLIEKLIDAEAYIAELREVSTGLLMEIATALDGSEELAENEDGLLLAVRIDHSAKEKLKAFARIAKAARKEAE